MMPIIHSVTGFLVILNPFALCLYLGGLIDELDTRTFAKVLARAGLISFGVFIIFAMGGEAILEDVLGLQAGALRVFGGLIFLVIAYNYTTRGYHATEMLRGSVEQLPSAIAMPFMIGAGTITQSILIGKAHPHLTGIGVLAMGVAVAILVVLAFKLFRDRLRGAREHLFERYVNILARINGLLIGAVSISMIVTGIQGLWEEGPPPV